MKTAEAKSTHSQKHGAAETSFFSQEQDSAFFKERSPEPRPFFPVAATSSLIQPKYASEPKPFFQPTAVPFIQAKCGACEAEEGEQAKEQSAETLTLQRMPAFESDEAEVQRQPLSSAIPLTVQRIPAFESEADDHVQSKSLLQRQAETEMEPEEEASPDTELQTKLASNAVDPPEDGGESGENRLPFTQATPTIGKPNDRYEQEADAVADQVVAMPKQRANLAPGIQTKPLRKNISKLVQRQEVLLQPKRLQGLPKVQKQGNGSLRASNDVASRLHSNRGSGSSLDENSRSEMESAFGADFGDVRVHTGSNAAQLSKDLGAKAFTHGSDIYFNQGQYNPNSSEGKHLLAHELTHTIQQGAVGTPTLAPKVLKGRTQIQRAKKGSWWRRGWKWVSGKAAAKLRSLLKAFAKILPGYFLIQLILGHDPITGKKIEFTGISILKAALRLLGKKRGDELFAQLQKAGTAEEAGLWIDGRIKNLKSIWASIKTLVATIKKGIKFAWKNRGFIQATINDIWLQGKQFINSVVSKFKEFILAGALKLAGSAGAKVLAFFKKSKEVFAKILADPVQFIKNFLSAFAQGFGRFSKNILKHLKGAIFGWLFGKLSSAGVEIKLPKKFDAKGIFGLVAQVLEITYEGIKARLLKHPKVKALGPKGAKMIELLEKSVGFVKALATKGPIVLWEKVEQSLGNLKQMVFDKLKQWVALQVIGKAITKLLLMMNPAGALLAVAEGIYKVVMFFIDRWDQIKSLVVSIFGSIRDIAFGNLTKAIAYVEKVLATGLTLVISFMARYVGLGGIGKEVQRILKEIRKPIDRAMKRVIGWLVKKAKTLWKKGKAAVKKIIAWWKSRKKFRAKSGEEHSIFFENKKSKKVMVSSSQVMYIEAFIRSTEHSKEDLTNTSDKSKLENQVILLKNKLNKLETHLNLKESYQTQKTWSKKKKAWTTQFNQKLNGIGVTIKNIMDLVGYSQIDPQQLNGTLILKIPDSYMDHIRNTLYEGLVSWSSIKTSHKGSKEDYPDYLTELMRQAFFIKYKALKKGKLASVTHIFRKAFNWHGKFLKWDLNENKYYGICDMNITTYFDQHVSDFQREYEKRGDSALGDKIHSIARQYCKDHEPYELDHLIPLAAHWVKRGHRVKDKKGNFSPTDSSLPFGRKEMFHDSNLKFVTKYFNRKKKGFNPLDGKTYEYNEVPYLIVQITNGKIDDKLFDSNYLIKSKSKKSPLQFNLKDKSNKIYKVEGKDLVKKLKG